MCTRNIGKKLNDYCIPKRNKHYSRYMFLKMRPQIGETTVAYATRLREKAHDCDFGTNQDERIPEHLIQTIENQTLIQKCISKALTLEKFLSAAGQTENISEQVHEMKTDPWSKEIAKVAERRRYSTSKNSDRVREAKEQNTALIVDCQGHILREETVLHMECSVKSAKCLIISHLFAEQTQVLQKQGMNLQRDMVSRRKRGWRKLRRLILTVRWVQMMNF